MVQQRLESVTKKANMYKKAFIFFKEDEQSTAVPITPENNESLKKE